MLARVHTATSLRERRAGPIVYGARARSRASMEACGDARFEHTRGPALST